MHLANPIRTSGNQTLTQVMGIALIASAAAVAAFVPAQTAEAGGLGIILHGGMHNEHLWYYSKTTDGVAIEDPANYDQYEMDQVIPHFGGGLNWVLGDRDGKVVGDFRLYYMQDAPQKNPVDLGSEVSAEDIVVNERDAVRHVGMGMLGINWGIFGDPGGAMFSVSAHVGSGFITTDHTEFLAADVGPQVSYKLNRQMQMFGEVLYQVRSRKRLSHSANAFVGLRYMFD